MLILIIVVVILFLILPTKWATLVSLALAFMYHQKRLRFSNVGDASSVNVMHGKKKKKAYPKEEDKLTTNLREGTLERLRMHHEDELKQIRMRREHELARIKWLEEGRKLRPLAELGEADERMEGISHMMIQADKAESNDKPIAVRTLEYPYSQIMREKGEREAASILERLKGDDRIYEVDDIIGSRLRKGKREYLIKWKGYGDEENTYEPSKNIPRELIKEFREKQRERRPVYGRSRRGVRK